MAQSNNIEIFVQEFNKLDNYLRHIGNYSNYDSIAQIINKEAVNNKIIREYKDDLDSFRELRNTLVHQKGLYSEPFADPYPATIKRLKDISDMIIKPPTAYSICVKSVAKATVTDSIKEVLSAMHTKGYTITPVVEDDVVVGVLSEYSILKWVARQSG